MSYFMNIDEDYNSEEDQDWKPGSDDEEDEDDDGDSKIASQDDEDDDEGVKKKKPSKAASKSKEIAAGTKRKRKPSAKVKESVDAAPTTMSYFMNIDEDYNSEEDQDWKPGSQDEEDDDDDDSKIATDDDDDKPPDEDPKKKKGGKAAGTKRKKPATKSKEPAAKRAKKAPKKMKGGKKEKIVKEEEAGDEDEEKDLTFLGKEEEEMVDKSSRSYITCHIAQEKPRNPSFPLPIFTTATETFLTNRDALLSKAQFEFDESLHNLQQIDATHKRLKSEATQKKKALKEKRERLEKEKIEEGRLYSVMGDVFSKVFVGNAATTPRIPSQFVPEFLERMLKALEESGLYVFHCLGVQMSGEEDASSDINVVIKKEFVPNEVIGVNGVGGDGNETPE
ncbi:hypothetical protein BC829DRAFT_440667 [Chytridium lagenaria]|nr:hypothetical protein BC829DRAFT_440667 [Chytridium lagenaria]